MLRSIFSGVAACLLASCNVASDVATPEPAIELTGRVVDQANILNASFENKLSESLTRLEEDTRVQLVVATTADLEGKAIDDYSLELANAWGIGDAERNDGLMILVAPNERDVRIEVGLGLEETVTNEEAAQIIKERILPLFRAGNFEGGVEQGVIGLEREVRHVELKEAA